MWQINSSICAMVLDASQGPLGYLERAILTVGAIMRLNQSVEDNVKISFHRNNFKVKNRKSCHFIVCMEVLLPYTANGISILL